MAGPRDYKQRTRSALVALSKGVCYEPKCLVPLIIVDSEDGEPYINYEIAHIRDARPGVRYDPTMSDDERRAFANLILLCQMHHTKVDKTYPAKYSIERLRAWKTDAQGPIDSADLDAISSVNLDEILRSFRTIHQQALKEQGRERLQATHSFVGEVIAEKDFSRLILRERDFSTAIGPKADFTEADLRGACFRGAELNAAQFIDADLRGCDFSGANLRHCEFRGSAFTSAVFDGARLGSADFRPFDDNRESPFARSPMSPAKLSVEDLQLAYESGVDRRLRHVSFVGADLNAADFRDLFVDGSDFSKAELFTTRFERCKFSTDVVFTEAHFAHTKLGGTEVMARPDEELTLSALIPPSAKLGPFDRLSFDQLPQDLADRVPIEMRPS